MHFGTSADFETELDEWMEDRCSIFEDAGDVATEQKLEWGGCFSDYCEWLDLKLETFCSDEGFTSEEVAVSMSTVLSDHSDAEFFPAFMACTDYPVFVRQMQERAIRSERAVESAAAADATIATGGVNISGVYNADPKTYDPESSEAYLKQLNCPWVFRKVLKRASRFVKDVCITQTDTTLTFAFTVHLFGTTVNASSFGETCTIKNLWRKDCTFKPDHPGPDQIRTTQSNNHGCPEGTLDRSVWWLEDGGDRLCQCFSVAAFFQDPNPSFFRSIWGVIVYFQCND